MRQHVGDGVAMRARLRKRWRALEVFTHADENNALAMLRHAQPLRVELFATYAIARILERFQNLKKISLGVAAHKTRDVLGDEDARLKLANDARVLEKQIIDALRTVRVRARMTPTLRATPGCRERSARGRPFEHVDFMSGK